MAFFNYFGISVSALTAERLRLDVIANNLANIETTRVNEEGEPVPYRRKSVVFAERLEQAMYGPQGRGVKVAAIVEDDAPSRMVYQPDHPDANEQGYVAYPNVNVVNEMIDMVGAVRAYEANIQALEASKQIVRHALEIGR
ncbi:MAG: flagellar basal body rod protein FlgC [Peptococcaceae bacterium]|nr:flagellar basal body rod protein FlgC [Peptococcaceae bacterium]